VALLSTLLAHVGVDDVVLTQAPIRLLLSSAATSVET
jgi:hypothetical protein